MILVRTLLAPKIGYSSVYKHILQMLPLLKKSTDNLVAVLGEKAESEETFEALKYVVTVSEQNTFMSSLVTLVPIPYPLARKRVW